jgi:pilus assembly protein TadC
MSGFVRSRWMGLLGLAVVVFLAGWAPNSAGHSVVPQLSPLVITPTGPSPNSTVATTTPTITASFTDPVSTVNANLVFLFVDGTNVTATDAVVVTPSSLTYSTPSILALKPGPANATIFATDMAGNTAEVSWNFTVNPNATVAPSPFSGIQPTTILLYLGIAAAVAGAVVGGYILYLKQTTRFTFRRYFATHPVQRKYFDLYIPIAAAFIFVIVGLDYVYNTPGLPPNAIDFVFIIAIFIALTAFGIDSRREMLRIRAYERAFAQFLFEVADAMRGGIDPAKAIVELSKTYTNILAKHLRIAADGIRMGRPFDAVLKDMVLPMQSKLIARYASLVSDATSVGGETATVVYRAAKDMDDFVKIEEEREKQLLLPVAVIYIAFGVLMAVLFALLAIGPELGSLNIGLLNVGGALNGKGAATSSVPNLSAATLKERFFELMIINALGTGAIIGAFTEGRARYGILHSLGLVAGTAIAFLILFP